VTTPNRILLGVALVMLCAAGNGCGRQSALPPPAPERALPAPPPPASYGSPDQMMLGDAMRGGRQLPPAEVANLSDRLLMENSSTLRDGETLARLEILLLKTLKNAPQELRARLMRNLGIIHYHNRKFKLALNEFQASNELNPKDARTHFYLARLYAHQGNIFLRQGQQKKSRGQFKLANMELELARKLDPANPAYRKNIKHILEQEQGR